MLQDKKLVENSELQALRHDLNSPLAALEIMLKENENLNESESLMMINCLENMKRIVSGKCQLKNFSIKDLLNEVSTQKRWEWREKTDIILNSNLDLDSHLQVYGDQQALRSVLSNILNNAKEAQNKSQCVIDLSAEELDKNLIIKIKDNGKGMAPEILEKVWDQGFSFGKSKQQNSGLGIGLHSAHKLIQEMNGEIFIGSTLFKGTTVTIILPLINKARIKAPSKVFLDDDFYLRKGLELKFKDMKVESVSTSKELLKNLSNYSKDKTHFFIDLNLGEDRSGLEVCKILKEHGFEKITLMTGQEPKNVDHPRWLPILNKMDIYHLPIE